MCIEYKYSSDKSCTGQSEPSHNSRTAAIKALRCLLVIIGPDLTANGPITRTGDGNYYSTLVWEPGEYITDERKLLFDNLGLAVVDEEHRFGVQQRRKLLAGRPDVLVMSATPIPRSLALTAYGDLELSVIDELPPGRTPIETKLIQDTARQQAYGFVMRQIREGRQAFVVTALIEENENLELLAATQLADMLRAGARLGSPFVRCFLGAQVDRGGPVPFADHVGACAEAITAVAPLARDLGMTIAVENHGFGDFLAGELRAFVERVGPDVCAITLDTGNPTFAAEDPARVAEVVAPYVVTTHFRDTAVWPDPSGARGQWVVLGRGTVDLRAILATLDAHAPDIAINIETITGMAPRAIPFDDSGEAGDAFRTLYPARPEGDLDRFRALVARGGALGIGPLDQWTGFPGPETPPEIAAKMRLQQRIHLEGSVAYAQDVLGLGRKRRAA